MMKLGKNTKTRQIGGLAGWLLGRITAGGRTQPRLELVERIALAPRQSLALVEAEGRRFLVATSPEGAPTFYALDERSNASRVRSFADRQTALARPVARVSW